MKLVAFGLLLASGTLSFGQQIMHIKGPTGAARLSANSIINNISNLRRLAALRQQLAEANSTYTAEHPKVKELQTQINVVDAALTTQVARSGSAEVIHLKGSVEIRTDTITLTADEADYYHSTGEIEARGSVRVRPNSK